MKLNKKKIMVISLALCLIAILSLGSIAWFSDSDEVTNNLKFDKKFAVDVYETDESGQIVKEGDETIGRTYEGLTPGMEIHKDPTVKNEGDLDQWVRMSVSITDYTKWAEVCAASGITDLSKIFTGFLDSAWTRYDEPTVDQDKDTITYVYYLNNKVTPGDKATLFTGVKIPTGMTKEQAEAIQYSRIVVKGEAIQTTDLGEGVDTCKEAFDAVYGN